MSNQYLINESTLTDIADAIRDKTDKIVFLKESLFTSWFTTEQGYVYIDLSNQVLETQFDTNSILEITINGISYQVNGWFNSYGESCFGDSRLSYNSDDYNINPIDVPFLFFYDAEYDDDYSFGGGSGTPFKRAYCDITISTPTEESYTIEIKEIIKDLVPIQAQEFANQIKSITMPRFTVTKPQNSDWRTITVYVKCQFGPTQPSGMNERSRGLEIFGYILNSNTGNVEEYYNYVQNTGSNYAIIEIRNVIPNSMLYLFHDGDSVIDGPYCEIRSMFPPGLISTSNNPSHIWIGLPLENASGYTYHYADINVECSNANASGV